MTRDELIAEVVRLRGKGLSYGQIGIRCGITKNAAIGIGQRAGLGTPLDKTEPKIVIPSGVCLWIDGEVCGHATRFCGKRIAAGHIEPWCKEHRLRVYTRVVRAEAAE